MFMISDVLQNQPFLRKIQTLTNFFNLFFPHSPKMHLTCQEVKFWKATKLNIQSHVQSLTKICLWCVQLVSV